MANTEKKQYVWDGQKYRSDDGLVEVPVRSGKILPMVDQEELEKMMPISEHEESELENLLERLKSGGSWSKEDRERVTELMKKRKRGPEFSSKPSISMEAVKALIGE